MLVNEIRSRDSQKKGIKQCVPYYYFAEHQAPENQHGFKKTISNNILLIVFWYKDELVKKPRMSFHGGYGHLINSYQVRHNSSH